MKILPINNNVIALLIFISGLFSALYVNYSVDKNWQEQSYVYDTYETSSGQTAYTFKGREVIIQDVVPYQQSSLTQQSLTQSATTPTIDHQWVTDSNNELKMLKPAFHFGLWSLFPAFITIALCLLTREPLTALFGGIVIGALTVSYTHLTLPTKRIV